MSERDADRSTEEAAFEATEVPEDERWPFGFMLTIVMVSIYLAYRLIQGAVLFVDWIF